jgi:hypothetical protein
MGPNACWSRPDLAPVSFEVHGPPKSIVPELTGIAVAAERSPTDEDLTILTDSKSSLQMLRGMQRQDFPVFLHRRAEPRILERVVRALNNCAEAGVRTRLVKFKAHSGENILGLSGRAPRRILVEELLTAVASSFSLLPSPDELQREEHPLHREELCLNREFGHVVTEDPPVCVVEAPPWRIITRDNRSKIVLISEEVGPSTHVGTVAQGRFSRLCAIFGQQRVLESLPDWKQRTEKSENSRGVASAQFWHGLKAASGAIGYIEGPKLLLPPYFQEAIAADDRSIRVPLPSGAFAPRSGR